MATRLYLRDTQLNALQAEFRDVSTTAGTAGAGTTTAVKEGLTGATGTTELQWTKTQPGGAIIEWTSAPLSGSVTIAGTITVQSSAWESAAQGNFGIRVKVFRRTSANAETLVSTITRGGATATELGTTASTRLATFTGTPTSTAFVATDRVVIRFYAISASGVTMGPEARTATLAYDSAAAAVGDTYVEFTENFAFSADVRNATPAAASPTATASLAPAAPTAAVLATPVAASFSATASFAPSDPVVAFVASPAAASFTATASFAGSAAFTETGRIQREDGGLVLREDGSFFLRESSAADTTALPVFFSAQASFAPSTPVAALVANPAAASLSATISFSPAAPVATYNGAPVAADYAVGIAFEAPPPVVAVGAAPDASAPDAAFTVAAAFESNEAVAVRLGWPLEASFTAVSDFAAPGPTALRSAEPDASAFAVTAGFTPVPAVVEAALLDIGRAAIAVSAAGRAASMSVRTGRVTLDFGA